MTNKIILNKLQKQNEQLIERLKLVEGALGRMQMKNMDKSSDGLVNINFTLTTNVEYEDDRKILKYLEDFFG